MFTQTTLSLSLSLTVYSQRPSIDVVGAVMAEDLPAHTAMVATPEHGEHRIALVANLAHFVLQDVGHGGVRQQQQQQQQ